MPLLNQVSARDPVSSVFLQGLEEGCPIIAKDALFYEAAGSSDDLEDEQDTAATDLVTRALYGAKTAETYTPTTTAIAKKIHWGKVSVDPVVEQRGKDPITNLEKITKKQGRKRGRRIQEQFITGNAGSIATDINGFNVLVGASQTLTGDDGGCVMPLGGDDYKLLQMQAVERVLNVARKVKACLYGDQMVNLYANSEWNSRLLMVSKPLGLYRDKDVIGNQIENLLGWIIPRDIGVDNAGADLLPWTEAYNGGNSSSIYLVGWGEEENVTCLTSQGLVGYTTIDDDGHAINGFDLDFGLGKQNDNALWRVTGWKKSE